MINETPKYSIKRLSIENINDMAQLHASVYSHAIAPDFFLKKYDTAYTGAKYIGYIAYNELHEPIAYYGVIPTLLCYNDRVILAAQSADTMTHPKFRNTGLFTELAKKTYELCRNEGVLLVFGFPNQNSLPGFINKLDWHMTETMDRFTIPVKEIIPLEKLVHKYPFFKPAYTRYKSWLLKKYLNLQPGVINSVLTDGYNGVFRDDNYLRYKTYSPTQVIQIKKSAVWIKLRNGLHIGDISGITDNFDKIMNKLSGLARKLGVAEIHFHASPQTKLHSLFVQRYQPIASFPVIFKDLGYDIATDSIKFTFADIDIF